MSFPPLERLDVQVMRAWELAMGEYDFSVLVSYDSMAPVAGMTEASNSKTPVWNTWISMDAPPATAQAVCFTLCGPDHEVLAQAKLPLSSEEGIAGTFQLSLQSRKTTGNSPVGMLLVTLRPVYSGGLVPRPEVAPGVVFRVELDVVSARDLEVTANSPVFVELAWTASDASLRTTTKAYLPSGTTWGERFSLDVPQQSGELLLAVMLDLTENQPQLLGKARLLLYPPFSGETDLQLYLNDARCGVVVIHMVPEVMEGDDAEHFPTSGSARPTSLPLALPPFTTLPPLPPSVESEADFPEGHRPMLPRPNRATIGDDASPNQLQLPPRLPSTLLAEQVFNRPTTPVATGPQTVFTNLPDEELSHTSAYSRFAPTDRALITMNPIYRITIRRARHIPRIPGSDPAYSVRLHAGSTTRPGEQRQSSRTHAKASASPEWQESFLVRLDRADLVLRVELILRSNGRDKIVGEGSIGLEHVALLLSYGSPDRWVPLTASTRERDTAGELLLGLAMPSDDELAAALSMPQDWPVAAVLDGPRPVALTGDRQEEPQVASRVAELSQALEQERRRKAELVVELEAADAARLLVQRRAKQTERELRRQNEQLLSTLESTQRQLVQTTERLQTLDVPTRPQQTPPEPAPARPPTPPRLGPGNWQTLYEEERQARMAAKAELTQAGCGRKQYFFR
eukprot:TRINITY_DN9026_c0_g1_i1.p1 TRINITY_DN9026_c0_g1~~TRINITY_DN9026_c0_g1_i1.p1  ORF type:complete len:684 (-),score=78.96 TRINITY_DN9026_c0_g1_i1:607-2658(-)